MKRILGILIVIIGLTISGVGVQNEGTEKLEVIGELDTSEAPPEEDFNYLILIGIAVTIGGVIVFFLPNKR